MGCAGVVEVFGVFFGLRHFWGWGWKGGISGVGWVGDGLEGWMEEGWNGGMRVRLRS